METSTAQAWSNLALPALVIVTIAMIFSVLRSRALSESRAGRRLAFVAFFILPMTITGLGLSAHLEHAKSTEFCLSCHAMEPYGKSLLIDDGDYLPAGHFQNGRIPRDNACFSCHTDYTMFGGVRGKLKGLQHVWVNYVGTVPETIELYDPYKNSQCLHCHAGARSFEDDELHAEMRDELVNEDTSCMECHDLIHSVDELDKLGRWSPGETAL